MAKIPDDLKLLHLIKARKDIIKSYYERETKRRPKAKKAIKMELSELTGYSVSHIYKIIKGD